MCVWLWTKTDEAGTTTTGRFSETYGGAELDAADETEVGADDGDVDLGAVEAAA
jgi:hypothetical protein